jgi:hypothetical protein
MTVFLQVDFDPFCRYGLQRDCDSVGTMQHKN